MNECRQSITVGTSQLPMDDATISVDAVDKDIITSVTSMMLK